MLKTACSLSTVPENSGSYEATKDQNHKSGTVQNEGAAQAP